MFIVFIISALAETNRAPFSCLKMSLLLLQEYFTEYSSMLFAMFFLGEYSAMILMSSLGTILFLGGWLPPFDYYIFNLVPGFLWFFIKVGLLLFVFMGKSNITKV